MTPPFQFERLSALIDAAAAVVGEVDLDHVLRRLVTEARSTTGAEYCALGVLGSHGILTDFIYEGIDPETAMNIGELPQGRGVLGSVVRERRTIVLDDIRAHPDSFGFPDGHPAMKSFLGVPVRAGNRVFGNLYLTDKPGGFDEYDVRLVEALAVIAGSAVSTARLRERMKSLAIVEDRDRIARDLHDSIIQDLFAVGLSLQGLSERVGDGSTSEILDRSVDQLHGVVETLRKYIYELKAADDLREGLSTQLRDLAERMANAYPTEIHVEIDGELDLIEVRIAEELLKLVTEAVSNALRHSRADKVTIGVHTDGEGVAVTIDDNGSGFELDKVKRGMGLINMRVRVERLGGVFEIEPVPGTGTRVSIRLPGL